MLISLRKKVDSGFKETTPRLGATLASSSCPSPVRIPTTEDSEEIQRGKNVYHEGTTEHAPIARQQRASKRQTEIGSRFQIVPERLPISVCLFDAAGLRRK